LNLPGFWIAENVVTNQEYLKFIETAYPAQTTESLEQIKGLPEDAPVHSVTWDEADAYCKWREAQTPGKHVRALAPVVVSGAFAVS
jgi:formylglycine-generating enzyme required for sulfatase activity